MKLSEQRIVVGIPTIQRNVSYLQETVAQVLESLPQNAQGRILTVVSSADPPDDAPSFLNLKQRFQREFELGWIQFRHAHRHPERDQLPAGLRRKAAWQRNLIDDFCDLVHHCAPLGSYYLHLEDDARLCADFWTKLEHWFERNQGQLRFFQGVSLYTIDKQLKDGQRFRGNDWVGTLGLFFKSPAAAAFADFACSRRTEAPLDSLLGQWSFDYGNPVLVTVPSLVDHRGFISSFEGATNDGRAPRFDQGWFAWLLREAQCLKVKLRNLRNLRLGRRPEATASVLFFQYSLNPPEAGNATACRMLQALQTRSGVRLVCWVQPDWLVLNEHYGTSLDPGRFEVVLVSSWLRRLFAAVPTGVARVLFHIHATINWFHYSCRATRLGQAAPLFVSAYQEIHLGNPLAQASDITHQQFMTNFLRLVDQHAPWDRPSIA
jgi:hypothetical protein